MFKEIPKRITYAQARLIDKIERRQLRKWCLENGLSHPAMYTLAVGDRPVTYKLMCSFAHLIAPIEWLYYTDEKLPYESVLVPPFDFNKLSRFVASHRFDYRDVAKKYNITELNAYNIFVVYRARPSISFIRACCVDVNPIEFFINSECTVNKDYTPCRGDIINYQNNLYLVLSSVEYNTLHKMFTGCAICATCDNALSLQDNIITKGVVNLSSIQSFQIDSKKLSLIERVTDDFAQNILEKVRQIFV